MSASYTLLVPLMLVSAITLLLLSRVTLYDKQVYTRLVSPAHLGEFARGLLEEMHVHEAVKPRRVRVIPEDMRFGDLVQTVTQSAHIYYPVVNNRGEMTGILSINDIREIMFEETVAQLIVAKDVATPNVVRVFWDDNLQVALDKMALLNVDELPVVKEEAPNEIVAMISKRDIVGYYHTKSTR
jgi:CIC family chloride channel protein